MQIHLEMAAMNESISSSNFPPPASTNIDEDHDTPIPDANEGNVLPQPSPICHQPPNNPMPMPHAHSTISSVKTYGNYSTSPHQIASALTTPARDLRGNLKPTSVFPRGSPEYEAQTRYILNQFHIVKPQFVEPIIDRISSDNIATLKEIETTAYHRKDVRSK